MWRSVMCHRSSLMWATGTLVHAVLTAAQGLSGHHGTGQGSCTHLVLITTTTSWSLQQLPKLLQASLDGWQVLFVVLHAVVLAVCLVQVG